MTYDTWLSTEPDHGFEPPEEDEDVEDVPRRPRLCYVNQTHAFGIGADFEWVVSYGPMGCSSCWFIVPGSIEE